MGLREQWNKLTHPGLVGCMRCDGGRGQMGTWPTIWYGGGSGVSPLCRRCWDVTTVEEKVDAMRRLAFEWWDEADQSSLPAIEAALLQDPIPTSFEMGLELRRTHGGIA